MDGLEPQEQERILATLLAYYRPDGLARSPTSESAKEPTHIQPFAQEEKDPKAFLKDKGPNTDVERVACLAFYLTHFRDTPHFKTQDLSKLNTEAAQPKFSNASTTAANAMKTGYLAQAPQGHRQISAFGEEFVSALPDRDAAKKVIRSLRPKRKARKRSTASGSGQAQSGTE